MHRTLQLYSVLCGCGTSRPQAPAHPRAHRFTVSLQAHVHPHLLPNAHASGLAAVALLAALANSTLAVLSVAVLPCLNTLNSQAHAQLGPLALARNVRIHV